MRREVVEWGSRRVRTGFMGPGLLVDPKVGGGYADRDVGNTEKGLKRFVGQIDYQENDKK
eukprot:2369685-Rhodomonas_salina.2